MTLDSSLHIATKHGDTRIIALLLKYNADIHIKNLLNKTPFDVAKKCDATIQYMFSDEFRKSLSLLRTVYFKV